VADDVAVVAGVAFPDLDAEREVLGGIGVRVLDARDLDREGVLAAARTAVALLVDYFRCDAEAIAGLQRCRVICQYGMGLDAIDVDAATRAGIVVTHTPGYCTGDLADHAVALMLAATRRLVRYDASVRAGEWDYNVGMPLRRFSGGTVGLIGLGAVGRTVARRLSGFDVRILAVDDGVDDDAFAAAGAERATLARVLAESDVISVHAPLTDETRGLVGEQALRAVKPGAILVNTARGAIVDAAALQRALDRGQLAGAALDVLESEPPDPGDPLLHRQDVTLTPHAGFLSVQSLQDAQRTAAEEVRRVLAGETPRHAVNHPAEVGTR
jgi:D-3-phosphoglycerate dehydrogenase